MLLEDMLDYLTTGSIGLTGGTNLFGGMLPDAPERAAAVYETGGLFPLQAMGRTSAVVERPRIQVVTRASSYQGARMLAHNVFERLDTVREATINGTRYHYIAAVQSPFFLREDESGRKLIACNYDVIKDVHTSTST